MKFPNQDKTIFDNFAGGAPQPPRVEHVLPGPEEPLPSAIEASETTTWVNQDLKAAEQDAPGAAATPEKVSDLPPKAIESAAQRKTDSAEKPIDSSIESYTSPAAKPAEPAAKPVAAKSAPDPVPAKAKAKVQLGAYRSEKEAQASFVRIQKNFGELAGRKPQVVRADLGDKGVFFRLRVGVADAKATCKALLAKGQACIAVSE